MALLGEAFLWLGDGGRTFSSRQPRPRPQLSHPLIPLNQPQGPWSRVSPAQEPRSSTLHSSVTCSLIHLLWTIVLPRARCYGEWSRSGEG